MRFRRVRQAEAVCSLTKKMATIPTDATGADAAAASSRANAEGGVTWVNSYVSPDKKTFCIYDGPLPEAIRSADIRSDLPFDRITEVRVLDLYF
jgi:Protein of unknown function (DUF4242)